MSNIAIIPARGGSKRFPDKNLALLAGKPLIQYSIDYALANSELVDGVYVSTDSSAIKEVAKACGASVIDRPAEISGDHSPTIDTLKHALHMIPEKAQHLILLQPTNPLRPADLLREAFALYQKGDYDSLMTVSRSHHKLGTITDNRYKPYNYRMGQRSQDLTPLYYENGLLYITRSASIEKGVILADRNLPYIVTSPMAEVDIDTPDDLLYAEFLLKK